MSIVADSRDGVQILRLGGDIAIGRHIGQPLDLRGRPLDDLRDTIEKLLESGKPKIVLDLAKVRFIDSAGLGELIAYKKRATGFGGDIKILRPSSKVQELLVMTLLSDVFEVFQAEDEAVESFAPA